MSAPSSGCFVCGQELVYSETAIPVVCSLCGATGESTARCAAGHYVCDACHGSSAKDFIERLCNASAERDAMVLALRLMAHPKVAMHGPEHHFLVPAALLTAWLNARDPGAKAEKLREARRRSESVLGGVCGTHGACGAGIGAGIFVSLVTGATPLTKESRGLSNLATSECLAVIARSGGPRCCKRDSWLAILTMARFARAHLGGELEASPSVDPCAYSTVNLQCLEKECPFYRQRP